MKDTKEDPEKVLFRFETVCRTFTYNHYGQTKAAYSTQDSKAY